MPTVPTVKWCRNASDEAHMDELGFKYKFVENYPFSSINAEASLHNNARFGEAIDDERVLEYAGFMELGSVFPAIVIFLPKGMIIGGNHRFKAAEFIGATCADAYLVLSGEECKIREFIYLNNRHGLENKDRDEAKIQEVLSMHKLCKPMTLMDACTKVFGRRDMYKQCTARFHRAHVVEALRMNGISQHRIDEMLKSRPSILDALYTLYPSKTGGLGNVKLLVSTFRAADDLRLSTASAEGLICKVKEKKNEKEQQQVVRAFVDAYEEEVKEKPTPNQTLLRSGTSRMHTLLCSGAGFKSFDDFPITDLEERKELIAQFKDITRAFKLLEATNKEK